MHTYKQTSLSVGVAMRLDVASLDKQEPNCEVRVEIENVSADIVIVFFSSLTGQVQFRQKKTEDSREIMVISRPMSLNFGKIRANESIDLMPGEFIGFRKTVRCAKGAEYKIGLSYKCSGRSVSEIKIDTEWQSLPKVK